MASPPKRRRRGDPFWLGGYLFPALGTSLAARMQLCLVLLLLMGPTSSTDSSGARRRERSGEVSVFRGADLMVQ